MKNEQHYQIPSETSIQFMNRLVGQTIEEGASVVYIWRGKFLKPIDYVIGGNLATVFKKEKPLLAFRLI